MSLYAGHRLPGSPLPSATEHGGLTRLPAVPLLWSAALGPHRRPLGPQARSHAFWWTGGACCFSQRLLPRAATCSRRNSIAVVIWASVLWACVHTQSPCHLPPQLRHQPGVAPTGVNNKRNRSTLHSAHSDVPHPTLAVPGGRLGGKIPCPAPNPAFVNTLSQKQHVHPGRFFPLHRKCLRMVRCPPAPPPQRAGMQPAAVSLPQQLRHQVVKLHSGRA